MKTFLVLVILAAVLLSCRHSSAPKFYGEAFDTTQVISVADLMQPANQSRPVTIKGIISSSCQDDGCWLNLANPGGDEVYVDWDEKFHLPLDISGKKVLIHGEAYIDSSAEGKPVAIKASGVRL